MTGSEHPKKYDTSYRTRTTRKLIFGIIVHGFALCICLLQLTTQCGGAGLTAQDVCTACSCLKGLGGPQGDQLEVSIDCSDRKLKELPVDWPFNMTASEDFADARLVVSMSGNPIQTLQKLPETKARNVSLRFQNCGLAEIVSAAFLDVPYIEELDLSYNYLTTESLHGDVLRGHYDNRRYEPLPLRALGLSHNRFFGGLHANALEHAPDLRRLDLGHNDLRRLAGPTAQAIATAKMLEFLDLSHTGISTVPEQLMKALSNLKELSLRGNAFLTVPETLAFTGQTLQKLDIGNNPVAILGDESFLGLNRLDHLKINHMMSLTAAMSNVFASLPSLKVLRMENCPRLEHIAQDAFMDAVLNNRSWHLQELHLQNGNLTTLPHALMDWPQLRVLNLDGNPWHCNCRLVVSIAAHHNATIRSLARCKSPYDRAGMLVKTVAKEDCLGKRTFIDDEEPNDISTVRPRSTRNRSPYSRPSVIAALVLFVVVLGALGAALGCLGSCLRERLRRGGAAGQPIKYTHMRESVISQHA